MSHISLSVLFYCCCQAFSKRLHWKSRNGAAVAFPALQPCAGAVWEWWHRAGGTKHPGVSEMAVPTPHSPAFLELLPARDSFPASLNPAAVGSWKQRVVAQLYLCLPPPCARGTLLFSLAWGGSECSCWEKLSPAIQQCGRAGMRMSWDLRIWDPLLTLHCEPFGSFSNKCH